MPTDSISANGRVDRRVRLPPTATAKDISGAEFAQENWKMARDAAQKFEDAMDSLRNLIAT